jgi:hypothetical protein
LGAVWVIGIIAGLVMFIAKFGGMILLTGGNKGVSFFGKRIYPYKWIMKSHVRKGLLDLLLGSMVAHIFMGSILGTIAAVTFAAISMAVLMSGIFIDWAKEKVVEVKGRMNLAKI